MSQSTTTESRGESYSQTTAQVRVTVFPEFLPDRSEINRGIYAHAYRVVIENIGTDTIQLLNRHWKVTSGGRQIADVKGEGVIGEQPVLQGGESFEYQSWTIVKDAVGAMLGSYTFVSERGDFFDVVVPEFPLIYLDRLTVH